MSIRPINKDARIYMTSASRSRRMNLTATDWSRVVRRLLRVCHRSDEVVRPARPRSRRAMIRPWPIRSTTSRTAFNPSPRVRTRPHGCSARVPCEPCGRLTRLASACCRAEIDRMVRGPPASTPTDDVRSTSDRQYVCTQRRDTDAQRHFIAHRTTMTSDAHNDGALTRIDDMARVLDLCVRQVTAAATRVIHCPSMMERIATRSAIAHSRRSPSESTSATCQLKATTANAIDRVSDIDSG
jgi:hypothetical protein